MAIYHLSAKVIGRSSGRSVVAASAYRAGQRLTNDHDGLTHDYHRRRGVEHAEVMAPTNAPSWMSDRSKLWNAVEAAEKRKDAQLAREIEIALPRELTPDQRRELVRAFVGQEFVSRGMIADVAIHCPAARDGEAQPHAHVLLTTRVLTGDGFGQKERAWNAKDVLEGWRARWAEAQNRTLEKAGVEVRVDHRSLADQRAEALAAGDAERAERLDREPEPKIGLPAVGLDRRKPGASWRASGCQGVRDRNTERRAIREELRQVSGQVLEYAEALRGLVSDQARRLAAVAERLEPAIQGRLQALGDRQWYASSRLTAQGAKLDQRKADRETGHDWYKSPPPVAQKPVERDPGDDWYKQPSSPPSAPEAIQWPPERAPVSDSPSPPSPVAPKQPSLFGRVLGALGEWSEQRRAAEVSAIKARYHVRMEPILPVGVPSVHLAERQHFTDKRVSPAGRTIGFLPHRPVVWDRQADEGRGAPASSADADRLRPLFMAEIVAARAYHEQYISNRLVERDEEAIAEEAARQRQEQARQRELAEIRRLLPEVSEVTAGSAPGKVRYHWSDDLTEQERQRRNQLYGKHYDTVKPLLIGIFRERSPEAWKDWKKRQNDGHEH